MQMTKSKTITLVPALPGWSVAHLTFSDSNYDPATASLAFDPILAWEITRGEDYYGKDYYDVSPITLDGIPSDSDHWAIKRSDGIFEIPATRTFGTEEETLDYLRESYREAREEARKKAATT
jgi:hypothetical protein